MTRTWMHGLHWMAVPSLPHVLRDVFEGCEREKRVAGNIVRGGKERAGSCRGRCCLAAAAGVVCGVRADLFCVSRFPRRGRGGDPARLLACWWRHDGTYFITAAAVDSPQPSPTNAPTQRLGHTAVPQHTPAQRILATTAVSLPSCSFRRVVVRGCNCGPPRFFPSALADFACISSQKSPLKIRHFHVHSRILSL